MHKEIEKIFVELITKSLNLPETYGVDKNGNDIPCVTIGSQNIKLFNTPKLQITVSTLSNRVYANRKEYSSTVTLSEKVCVNDQRVMQIDVYSRNNDARQRFWEIQACLNSTLCEQLQDKYQFRISRISNSYNLSGIDGGSEINRYTIRFNCLCWYEKEMLPDYYAAFGTEVWNKTPEKFAEFEFTST